MEIDSHGPIDFHTLPEFFFFYFPEEKEKKQWVTKKEGHRFIFEGVDSLDEFELSALISLQNHIEISTQSFEIEMETPQVLRTLQESRFDNKKTIQKLGATRTKWENFQPKKPSKVVLDFLSKGLLYVHGFDHRFRPIVVMRLGSVQEEAPNSFGLLSEALEYVLDYVVQHMMLGGQIENWVLFVDFENKFIPIEYLSHVFNFFHTYYPSRAFRYYLLQVSKGWYKLPILRGALSNISENLLILLEGSKTSKMLEHIHQSQIDLTALCFYTFNNSLR